MRIRIESGPTPTSARVVDVGTGQEIEGASVLIFSMREGRENRAVIEVVGAELAAEVDGPHEQLRRAS